MEIEEICKFPSLLKNEGLNDVLQAAVNAEGIARTLMTMVQSAINDIQRECQHEWGKREDGFTIGKFTDKNENANFYLGKVPRICILCGLPEEKPDN